MPNTSNLDQMFRWQTRVGLAPKFGSRPIAYYQEDQICALEVIEHLAKRRLGLPISGRGFDFEVRAKGASVQARPAGSRAKFETVGSFDEVRRRSHACARRDKSTAFAGARSGRR